MNPTTLYPRAIYARFEGGVIYTAEKDGRFYAIIDEGTMADFLAKEELEGMTFVKVLDFDTEAERIAFLMQRYGRKR